MSRNSFVRTHFALYFFFGITSLFLMQCGRGTIIPTTECGKGFTYSLTEQRCVPEANFNCNPACDSDHRCVEGKCLPRLPDSPDEGQLQKCAITCADGQICENGRCVQSPCLGGCKNPGEVCVNGVCSPTSECIPPCPQTGFVCVTGICKRLCPATCPTGTQCSEERGVCEKPCNPACATGEFCNDGKCIKIEDKDGDGYASDRDCNDNDKTVNPKAVEVCDGKDNDCDGLIDNIVPRECYDGPQGTLGLGVCRSGRTRCDKGKEICDAFVGPQPETCDGKDNDCNGQIDDNCK